MKFRLVLKEDDFDIIYIKEHDNVIVDALSRIVITSKELKSMYEEISVMTRVLKKRKDYMENAERNLDMDETRISNKSINERSDQP